MTFQEFAKTLPDGDVVFEMDNKTKAIFATINESEYNSIVAAGEKSGIEKAIKEFKDAYDHVCLGDPKNWRQIKTEILTELNKMKG